MMPGLPSGTITAKKMWELVAVIEASPDDDGAHKRKDADGAKEEVLLSLQEQAATTISDLAYGDEDMQDAIIEAGGVPPLLVATQWIAASTGKCSEGNLAFVCRYRQSRHDRLRFDLSSSRLPLERESSGLAAAVISTWLKELLSNERK